MAKTLYRTHRLFRIYRERRTHGKKRLRYGFWPDFGWTFIEDHAVVQDTHWVNEGRPTAIDFAQACQRSGYDLERMLRPGFRFQNRREAEQFYTMMILSLGA